MQGTIHKVIHSGGFGFIRANDGRDVFFHRINLQEVDFRTLRQGLPVEFELQHGEFELRGGEKGLRAAIVRVPAERARRYSTDRPNGAHV